MTCRKPKMLKALDSHVWERAFTFALSPATGLDGTPQHPPGILHKSFTREDVSRIIAIKKANEHSRGWACLCRLNDRRYALVYAGSYIEDRDWKQRGYGWAYTNFSLVDMFADWVGPDCKKHLAQSIRKFAHSDDMESDTREEILELVLQGVI